MSKALGIVHGPFGRALLLELDRPLTTHAHAQAHLLIKLAGPDTRFRIGELELTLGGSHAIHVRPWEAHAFAHGRQPEAAIVLALYLEPDWLDACGAVLRQPQPRLSAAAMTTAAALCDALRGDTNDQAERMPGRIRDLLGQLDPDTESLPFAAPRPVDRRLRKALTLIHTRAAEAVDFAALASEAGLSRAHFFELFRRDLGLTPAVYLNTHRMALAIAAVEQPAGPSIGALALDLGFSAQSNFTRFFRDIQGVPPNDYRQAARTLQACPDQTRG